MIAFLAACSLTSPAVAASRWQPAQPPATDMGGPLLLSRLSVKGRIYALFRDPKSQAYLLSIRGHKEIVDEVSARSIRSEMVGAAWKMQYLARLAHHPLGQCRSPAAEVVVPATDDRIRVCIRETAPLRDLQLIASRLEKRFPRKFARR